MGVLVTGAGGFIGGHLVRDLIANGLSVRAVDRKPLEEWSQVSLSAENLSRDCALLDSAREITSGIDQVFNLAADMGGMGFIENNKAACMLSVLINTHMLKASLENGVDRFFFGSSACVYAAEHQRDPNVTALIESDAYPAMPEDGYGWEKLFSERMCRHFREDYGLTTRAARYHNVYGPLGTFAGGREKAPAAICRKVVEATLNGTDEIEIWGDGKQTRSFMYIDDCVRGTLEIADGDYVEPLNLGSAELVSINELVDIVEGIAGTSLERRYLLDAPQGVRGRNSDNTEFRRVYGWEPSISLQEGLRQTYDWIQGELVKAHGQTS
jgi:nucleoside-diphosphate-sugar epimerase